MVGLTTNVTAFNPVSTFSPPAHRIATPSAIALPAGMGKLKGSIYRYRRDDTQGNRIQVPVCTAPASKIDNCVSAKPVCALDSRHQIALVDFFREQGVSFDQKSDWPRVPLKNLYVLLHRDAGSAISNYRADRLPQTAISENLIRHLSKARDYHPVSDGEGFHVDIHAQHVMFGQFLTDLLSGGDIGNAMQFGSFDFTKAIRLGEPISVLKRVFATTLSMRFESADSAPRLERKIWEWAAASILAQIQPTFARTDTPPDLIYGSSDWALLDAAIQLSNNLGLDHGDYTHDELIALGRVAVIAAKFNPNIASHLWAAQVSTALWYGHAQKQIDLRRQELNPLAMTRMTLYLTRAVTQPIVDLIDGMQMLRTRKPRFTYDEWRQKAIDAHRLRGFNNFIVGKWKAFDENHASNFEIILKNALSDLPSVHAGNWQQETFRIYRPGVNIYTNSTTHSYSTIQYQHARHGVVVETRDREKSTYYCISVAPGLPNGPVMPIDAANEEEARQHILQYPTYYLYRDDVTSSSSTQFTKVTIALLEEQQNPGFNRTLDSRIAAVSRHIFNTPINRTPRTAPAMKAAEAVLQRRAVLLDCFSAAYFDQLTTDLKACGMAIPERYLHVLRNPRLPLYQQRTYAAILADESPSGPLTSVMTQVWQAWQDPSPTAEISLPALRSARSAAPGADFPTAASLLLNRQRARKNRLGTLNAGLTLASNAPLPKEFSLPLYLAMQRHTLTRRIARAVAALLDGPAMRLPAPAQAAGPRASGPLPPRFQGSAFNDARRIGRRFVIPAGVAVRSGDDAEAEAEGRFSIFLDDQEYRFNAFDGSRALRSVHEIQREEAATPHCLEERGALTNDGDSSETCLLFRRDPDRGDSLHLEPGHLLTPIQEEPVDGWTCQAPRLEQMTIEQQNSGIYTRQNLAIIDNFLYRGGRSPTPGNPDAQAQTLPIAYERLPSATTIGPAIRPLPERIDARLINLGEGRRPMLEYTLQSVPGPGPDDLVRTRIRRDVYSRPGRPPHVPAEILIEIAEGQYFQALLPASQAGGAVVSTLVLKKVTSSAMVRRFPAVKDATAKRKEKKPSFKLTITPANAATIIEIFQRCEMSDIVRTTSNSEHPNCLVDGGEREGNADSLLDCLQRHDFDRAAPLSGLLLNELQTALSKILISPAETALYRRELRERYQNREEGRVVFRELYLPPPSTGHDSAAEIKLREEVREILAKFSRIYPDLDFSTLTAMPALQNEFVRIFGQRNVAMAEVRTSDGTLHRYDSVSGGLQPPRRADDSPTDSEPASILVRDIPPDDLPNALPHLPNMSAVGMQQNRAADTERRMLSRIVGDFPQAELVVSVRLTSFLEICQSCILTCVAFAERFKNATVEYSNFPPRLKKTGAAPPTAPPKIEFKRALPHQQAVEELTV